MGKEKEGVRCKFPGEGPTAIKTRRAFHRVGRLRTTSGHAQKWQIRVSMKTEGLRSQAGQPASSQERHSQTWVVGGRLS